MPRILKHLASIITLIAAASFAIQAQELKDRQLATAYDFSTIQMPVAIASIKLNGKDIAPGEKIKGDDDWLKGISFTLKNVSDRKISYVNIGFRFPLPNGFVVVLVLNHGIDSSHGEIRRSPTPAPIQPGQTVELVLNKQRWDTFLHVLTQASAPRSFDTAPFYVERVSFENETDVIWQDGYLKRRNATDFGRFDPIQRYFLPSKEK